MLTIQNEDYLIEIIDQMDVYIEDKRAGTARQIEWAALPDEEDICTKLTNLFKEFNSCVKCLMT